MPFFKLLSAKKNFSWGEKEQEVFDEFKNYLENLATLSSPGESAKLLLYVSASDSTVSAALVEEKELDRKLRQVPMYFVSEALSGAKKFYSELEKMAYVVVMASRKLKHYFQGYTIIVPSAFPLREIFENSNPRGELVNGSQSCHNT